MSVSQYEERYCLFLDILGFQSHINDSVSKKAESNQTMTFARIKSTLEKISEGVHYREMLIKEDGKEVVSSREVTHFSDSVVISYKKNEDVAGSGILSMLVDVHRLQLQLVNNGVLLRGSITSGLLYHDKDYVFGPALNEAVILERLANYPRVILHADILNEAGIRSTNNNDYTRTISSMLSEDFDGLFYVDYFDIHPDDFNEDWNDMSYYLENLRGLIKSLANKKDLSIKVKHSWLRTKFNNIAKPFEKNGFTKLGYHDVPVEDVQLFTGIKPFN